MAHPRESHYILSMESSGNDPVVLRHRYLERIANTCLRLGRLLMETGCDVRTVHGWVEKVARALGAESVGIRSGYASLEITVGTFENTITRMTPVGRHGMDARLQRTLLELAQRVEQAPREAYTPDRLDRETEQLVAASPRHPTWVVLLAVGFACAAFSQLLGADARAFPPVFGASVVAQALRHFLGRRGINVFVSTALTAFTAASLSGLGARWLAVRALGLAMIASTLMLVPGVPATNAQTDIMEGFPTVGSARVVWVLMTMIFAAVGIWIAQALLGVGE